MLLYWGCTCCWYKSYGAAKKSHQMWGNAWINSGSSWIGWGKAELNNASGEMWHSKPTSGAEGCLSVQSLRWKAWKGQLVLPVTPAEMCELSLATAGMVGTQLYFMMQVAKLCTEDSVKCNLSRYLLVWLTQWMGTVEWMEMLDLAAVDAEVAWTIWGQGGLPTYSVALYPSIHIYRGRVNLILHLVIWWTRALVHKFDGIVPFLDMLWLCAGTGQFELHYGCILVSADKGNGIV